MPEQPTATTESRDPSVEWVDSPPTIARVRHPAVAIGGLATYYRLRCIVLETTVAALESELTRARRRLQNVVSRYEELLDRRECADGADPVFTHDSES
jgi:hypothetical protein